MVDEWTGEIVMKKIIFLLILFSVFLSRSGVQGRNTEPPQEKGQETFQYEVTVTLKLIQVFVTDGKGNPVIDLAQADFILYDNGKLKKITEFEKHRLFYFHLYSLFLWLL